MYIFMYVCMMCKEYVVYVYAHSTHMRICIYIYTNVICTYTCMRASIYLSIYINIYIHTHMHIYIYMFIYVFMYLFIYLFLCFKDVFIVYIPSYIHIACICLALLAFFARDDAPTTRRDGKPLASHADL